MKLKPSIHWLFAFIPITVGLEHAGVPDPVLFFSAALAIVPIAGLIVQSTEQIAHRTGDAIGGLLNATFGNAPELIIAIVALKAGNHELVRASIIGAILANLLLALGIAFFAGGIRNHTQEYNPAASRVYSTMMLIAAVSLTIPSAFSRFFSTGELIREEGLLNTGLAIVLLAAYALYLVFMGVWGLLIIGGSDNIVRPLLIGKGVDAPLSLVFLGVVGGIVAFGFLGLFIGPTLLVVAYNLFEEWMESEQPAAAPPIVVQVAP